MVEILENIPTKVANMMRIPGQRPVIRGNPGTEIIAYSNMDVPSGLKRKLLKKCKVDIKNEYDGLTKDQVEERIADTASNKNLYMRFAGDKPLSVVTDQFQEIHPEQIIKEASRALGVAPTIRYFKNDESLQLNFPIDEKFNGMNLF